MKTTPSIHGGQGPRILLYSHDSYGLGHLRRSLTLSEGLAGAFPNAQLLLVTGSPCATLFDPQERLGLVKLPSITKDASGEYVPGQMGGSLSFTMRLRRNLLLEAFRSFSPDLVIIDHKVIGMRGEAFELLLEAKEQGVATMLGVRDIIDSPSAVAAEWGDEKSRWALAEGYNRICVYGDPAVFDTKNEYPLPPELGERVEYTGYVVRPVRPRSRRPVPAIRPQVLVTMGGGQDGKQAVDAYLSGIEAKAPTWDTILVGGPLLGNTEARKLRRRGRLCGNVDVRRFYADMPRLLAECDAVVAMAGYNTVSEIMQSEKPCVLAPRTHPRMEQAIRADRLAKRGLAISLPDPRPSELRNAVHVALERGRLPKDAIPSLDGVKRVCEIAGDLLSVAPVCPQLESRTLVS